MKLLVACNMDHIPDFIEKAGYFDTVYKPVKYKELSEEITGYDYLMLSIKFKYGQKTAGGSC